MVEPETDEEYTRLGGLCDCRAAAMLDRGFLRGRVHLYVTFQGGKFALKSVAVASP